jgi:lipoprotein NlpI
VGVPTSLVQSILELALKLQNDLIAGGEDDPDLRRSESAALDETAQTLLDIGDTQNALAAALKSRDITRGLLKEQPGNALWQRDLSLRLERIGFANLQAGDQAGALAAYEESLGIRRDLAKDKNNPQAQGELSVTLADIGVVKLGLGRVEEARASFDAALVAAPDDVYAHLGRARAEFYAAKSTAAIDDMAAAVKLGAALPNYPYYVLWLHIVRQRAGTDDREEFAANVAKLDQAKWPWPVVALYLGQSNPDALLAAAHASEDPVTLKNQVCEADFYLGEDRLWNNDLAQARPLLQSAADDCRPSFDERAAAKLELARLK